MAKSCPEGLMSHVLLAAGFLAMLGLGVVSATHLQDNTIQLCCWIGVLLCLGYETILVRHIQRKREKEPREGIRARMREMTLYQKLTPPKAKKDCPRCRCGAKRNQGAKD